MIPDKLDIQITRSEDFKSTRSRVASTPDIKKLLRSKVYSNKPLACIREAATNAFDSHFEAGKKDIPIEITLPSVLEPTLKIKDYGVGLDDFGVREVLFSYGDSVGNNVKQTNNEEHGMFHIGAKSPLSYTNVFQVIAIKDKVKRTYTIYIGADEDDYIEQIDEKITDELNGVEISIPVKNEDISTFVSTAESFFKFWEPKPKISGNSDYSPEEPEYLIRGEYWAFLKPSRYYTDSSYVVMGGVPYRLNKSSIPNMEYGTPKYNILQKYVILYAHIGEVNVNAGREELEYTDKTIKFVVDRLELIENEAKKQVEDKIASAKTEYEVREIYYNFFSNFGSMGSILTEVLKGANFKLNYNGKVVDNYRFDVTGKITGAYRSQLEHQYRNRKGYVNSLSTSAETQLDIFQVLGNAANNDIVFDKCFYYIETDPNGVKKEITREKIINLLGYYSKEKFSKPLLGSNFITVCFEDQAKFDAWITETGIPATLFKNITTEIVIPPPPPKVKKPRVSSGLTRTYPADQLVDGHWKEVQVDIKAESGYYVTRFYSNRYLNYSEGNDPLGVTVNNDNELLGCGLNFLRSRELMPDEKIYAFTPKYVEKLDKSKWIPLEIYVKLALEQYNLTNNVNVFPVSKLSLDSGELKIFEWIKNGKFKIDDDHPIKAIISNISDEESSFKNYVELNKHFGLKIETYDINAFAKYKSLISKEYHKYPLLNEGDFSYYTDNDKDYLLYVNAKYLHLKELEIEKAAKKAEKELVGA